MKCLVLPVVLLISITTINSQVHFSDTIYGKDNLQPGLISGFYYAVADTSKSRGFKVYNADKYYFISKMPVVSMAEVDSIYKEYHSYMKKHVLIFKFNEKATVNWADFTKSYQQQQVALLLKDTIVYVGTIASEITSGVSWLAGVDSEKEIDRFKILFGDEIRKAKIKNKPN